MRYLEREEREKTRGLWEEAFPGDSREFVDYYYRNKIADNRILAEEEDGEVISMVQLNPYRVQVRDREYGLDYIVGVATREDRRHQGHMRRLLLQMLRDMRGAGTPFTFLMPAAEAIYRPFGFRYIFDQPHRAWKTAPVSGAGPVPGLTAEEIPSLDYPSPEAVRCLAAWQQKFLSERYEVLAVRDESYIRRLMSELASEKGVWTLFRDENGQAAAMESWWGLKEREQRFLYAPDSLTEETAPPSPAIMARITCVEEFLKSISLTGDAPVESLRILMQIKDPLIPENDGEFLWALDKMSSRAERMELPGGEEFDGEMTAEVEVLAEWLFGYRKPENLPDWAAWIRPLKGVFLDEVV